MKKILVTGADGFIGSHLTEHLIKLGFDVKAFVFYNSFLRVSLILVSTTFNHDSTPSSHYTGWLNLTTSPSGEVMAFISKASFYFGPKVVVILF